MNKEIKEIDIEVISFTSDGKHAESLHKVLTEEVRQWTAKNNQKKDFTIIDTSTSSSVTKRKRHGSGEDPFFLCLTTTIVYSYTRAEYINAKSKSEEEKVS